MAVSTVKVVINGQTYNLSYNSTSGKWEGTVTAPGVTSYNVNSGHYYPVTVTATDQAGNTTTKNDTDSTLGSSLKLIVKETTKPTVAVTSPASGARVTNSKPTISFQLRDETNGSGINISSLTLKIDGGSAIGNTATGMTCTSVTGGYNCSYVCQTALAQGSHTITVDIKDNDGNQASTSSLTFTVDTVPPVLNITAPTNNLITNKSSVTVSGTVSDATSSPVSVAIKLNGVDQGAVTVTSGSFSKALTLAEGSNTILVTATDSAGLTTSIARTVVLDTGAPNITAVSITPNPANSGATLTISVVVSD